MHESWLAVQSGFDAVKKNGARRSFFCASFFFLEKKRIIGYSIRYDAFYRQRHTTIRKAGDVYKRQGWQRYSLRIVSDKFTYQKKKNEDWYMKGFLKNIYLRPSCYECAFKGKVKESDFTLADFWGVEEILPEFYDKSGVSLLFVHSEKGMNLWRLVQEQFVSQEVSMEMALEKNRVAFSSSVRPSGRNVFFSTMGTVQTRVKKATEDYFWLKVIKKLRKLFRIERKRV